MFDKLKFWKKDEIDFDALAQQSMQDPIKSDFGMHDPLFPEETLSSPSLPSSTQSMPASGGGYNPRGSAPTYPQRQTEPISGNRDIELINSKLDTLRAMLNNIDQRLANIERSSSPQQPKQRLW